jgi:two-component system LytT family response regulator
VTTPIRAVVVDDQPVARDRLVALLAEEPDITVVGTCATGVEAVASIRADRPDLVFLDVQMPELDGLGVVEAIGADQMPVTVFVTAYDEFAVRAFEAQALDYLLKPFARQRFAQALTRVRRTLAERRDAALAGRLLTAVSALRPAGSAPAPPANRRLMVRSAGRVAFVEVEAIEWVEAEGNYVRLHTATQSHLLRETMGDLLVRLGEDAFFRIHRSRIVNLSRVESLRVAGGGDYDVVLASGRVLGLSRGYRDALQRRLQSLPPRRPET